MHNIVLIGMPGCGKSAIGQRLADQKGYVFVDLDQVIEAEFGQISALFEKGEAYFRSQETRALALVIRRAMQQPMVLATGGGIVVKQENIKKLKQFGKIIYIERSIDDILKSITESGRPWLEGDYREQLESRMNDRKPLYEQAADWTVQNNQSVEHCLQKILDWIGE